MKKSLALIGFVALISFALGGVAFSAHDFPDVPDSHPFHDDISWMASAGITEGFPDGTFKPGQAVTRQSMAAFMRRLAGADPAVPRVVDAAELGGRNAADFDNAVTLNGRTPADYDDAVTLGGRTPADYDNAVSLNGRTPADYDDAVTLQGRGPDDFDDAQTLAGSTAADLRTSSGDFQWTGTTGISGTTSGTASDLYAFGAGFDAMVTLTMVVDTSYDSGLFTCEVEGERIFGITDLKLGDATVGYTDRISVTGQYRLDAGGAQTVACYHESAMGSGSVTVMEWRRTYVEDN